MAVSIIRIVGKRTLQPAAVELHAPINNRSALDEYGAIGDGTHDGGNAVEGVGAPMVSERNNYGFKDYRSISRWKFPFQMLLRPRTRAKMSIGMLHVKVVQARGLMAKDFPGKSDPFAELELTGRYLSHGQEWSEKLRVREKTKTVMFSLNPVWNEEFSLPVRRSNATLRVKLWDWNLSIPHEPLGHVEVKIGDELLSKKEVDKWYVLHAPSDLHKKASGVDDSDVDNIPIDEAVFGEGGDETKDDGWGSNFLPEETIDERRKKYGEVRLELRFEFDNLAETCSHIWPEEPHKHPAKPFSPNRIFYSWLLLEKLLKPYLEFIDGTGRVVGWFSPWKSLLWLILFAFLVLHPSALIFAINGLVLWIVVTRYWSHVAALWKEDALDEDPLSTHHNIPSNGKAGTAAEDVEAGMAARAMNPMKKFQKTAHQLYQRAASFLPPMEEDTDQELMEIYTEVCRVKRLHNVVETVGKKTMSKDGQELQNNVEVWGTLLLNVRRIFHPLEATTLIVTVALIILHTLLQLWLLLASRMDLYFLIVVVGIFSASFYGWRGRAFILAVKAAHHNRRTRLAFTKTGATEGNDVAGGGAQRDPPANVGERSHLFGAAHRDRAADAGYSGDSRIKEAGEQHRVDEEEHKKKWKPVAVAAGGAVAVAVAPGAVAIAGVALAARAAVRASKSSAERHSWSSRPKLETPDVPSLSDGAAGATSVGGTARSLEQPQELPPSPWGQENVGLASGSSVGGMTPAEASGISAPAMATDTQSTSLPPLDVTEAPLPAPTVTPPSSPFKSKEASLFSSAGAVDGRGESGGGSVSPEVTDALPPAPASPTARHPLLPSAKASVGASTRAPDAGRADSGGRSNALHFGGYGSTLLGKAADNVSAGHASAPSHGGGAGTQQEEGQEEDEEESERNQRSKSAAHKFLHGPSHLMHKLSGKSHHWHHRDHSGAHAHDEDGTTSDPESHGRERSSTGSRKSHSGKWHRPHWGSGSSGSKRGGGEADLDTSHGTSRSDEEARGPETPGTGGKRKHGAKQRVSGLFHRR